MPELPEVETTRRGIEPHVAGHTVTAVELRRARLRWPIPADLPVLLKRRKLLSVNRRGKYLLLRFTHGHALLHLGMSGSLRVVAADQPPRKHDHVDIRFGNGAVLRFTDPRRFGALLWTAEPPAEHSLLRHLGPEPLTEAFNADYLFARSRKRKQAVKTLIMDSAVVVGVGNIYANEALYLAGIRPSRAAGGISRAACEALTANIKEVLAKAIAQGGTTLRDFVGGDGKPGYFKQQLWVYGRGGQPCGRCGKPLKEVRLGQRSTVYCTACQR
ncbi:bifunctional DNA-formamidopyrimidine glycosylase/DNA-(apurinic or apyrimidinic site) lyase [Exilibacterium tricleocarpae]|uniref:Formamidopyrimidine-DNA glycosylase n=1 Tax=Exilibacterium tricleocarpae TaxID=2591008 RepID=A0A545TZ92_9GAMM|nr:bifunctional DNA-formamidopyrimidine glycosylase/DNA-(apurinic or apyrimidinic site) lyase [Exilibacterium tricleocarpae]TQV82536.1 bifunctional DNA-formamidopyrimidine glycosylase/DNA-(apurinic or apyrimidinic site) lyase [Exilibacterium tricleocarpae]